ncbi:MAG: hypothetical protein KGQ61_10015 [Planctomycetes bacterium]|nr:hypothetical protein [Planctomycetota bacterium]
MGQFFGRRLGERLGAAARRGRARGELGGLRLGPWAAAVLVAVAVAPLHAGNLVINGSFETNTNGVGYLDYNTAATGWSNSGSTAGRPQAFNFIVDANADKRPGGGFNSELGTIWVWGPQYSEAPSANGFTGSGYGTYFLGGDGAYATGPVSQVIGGLTVNEQYTLSFVWGAAQFTDVKDQGFNAGWQISFGSEVANTETVSLPSRGFAPWRSFSTTFTASAVSQTLSFLATGGPAGVPPFSLLDNVSLEPTNGPPPPGVVPEIDASAATSVLALVGGVLGCAERRRRTRGAAR